MDWSLKVVDLGKVHGLGGADAVPGTGPEFRTQVSPLTGAIVAAWDTSFEVRAGEALGVIGESGSGKSTVLRCIAGDQPATTGHVFLRSIDDGRRDLLQASSAERRAWRVSEISVLYQNPAEGLDLRITAGGNIVDRLTAAGHRHFGAMRSWAAELLERVDVPIGRMDHLTGTFSGGMLQRIQLAKCLANRPSLVLFDEPTTGLDASIAAGVLDLIRDVLEQTRMTAVIVSHDMAVMEMLAERLVVMHHGRIVERGLTDQVIEDPQHWYTQRLVAAARG